LWVFLYNCIYSQAPMTFLVGIFMLGHGRLSSANIASQISFHVCDLVGRVTYARKENDNLISPVSFVKALCYSLEGHGFDSW
jgi:hypothetical protein